MHERKSDVVPPLHCLQGTLHAHEAAAAAGIHAALLLVLSELGDQDLLCSVPLVCRSWHAAASAVYGNRPLVRNCFQVQGSAKAQSLARWLQRNGSRLYKVELAGFKHSVGPAWWASIFSASLGNLQHLSLRSCGSPALPLAALAGSAPSLKSLKLEHTPSAPLAADLAGMRQLTSLVMRSCQVSLEHLRAVGQLPNLVVLELPANSFVLEQPAQLHTPTTSMHHRNADGARGGNSDCNSASSTPPSTAAEAGKAAAASDTAQQPQQCWPDSSCGLVSSWVTGLRHLQRLDLSDCRLQEGLLDQLPTLTTLTHLALRRASLDAKGAAAGMHGTAAQLQRLTVGVDEGLYNQHTLALGAGAAASCAVVGRMRWLLELDVSYIANACEQLCAGACMAGGPMALTTLNIAHTGCTEVQLQQLMACCPNMKVLLAGGNEALNSIGGCCI